jgi:hypothetical protein
MILAEDMLYEIIKYKKNESIRLLNKKWWKYYDLIHQRKIVSVSYYSTKVSECPVFVVNSKYKIIFTSNTTILIYNMKKKKQIFFARCPDYRIREFDCCLPHLLYMCWLQYQDDPNLWTLYNTVKKLI